MYLQSSHILITVTHIFEDVYWCTLGTCVFPTSAAARWISSLVTLFFIESSVWLACWLGGSFLFTFVTLCISEPAFIRSMSIPCTSEAWFSVMSPVFPSLEFVAAPSLYCSSSTASFVAVYTATEMSSALPNVRFLSDNKCFCVCSFRRVVYVEENLQSCLRIHNILTGF